MDTTSSFDKVNPPEPRGLKISKALNLYNLERYEEVVSECVDLLNDYADDFQVHNLLGNAYYRVQNYQEAAKEYEKVLRLDPFNEKACENLGVVYANLGDLNNAIHQWERLLEIAPQRDDVRESINRAKQFLEHS